MKFHTIVHRIVQVSLASSLVVVFLFSALTSSGTASAASPVVIDGSIGHQVIDGFGMSEAFGMADVIKNAPVNEQQQVLNLLFNPFNGAGLTILRNLLPSDPTHTIEPNSPGSPTAPPQYVWDGDSWGQVWLSQQALKFGVRQIYADTWSAPGFMKTNGDEANGGTLCGAPGAAACSTGDWRQAFANYLAQYIKDYQSDGVRLTQLGFVNEPSFTAPYSSMVMNPAQMADFAKVLGPTLRQQHLDTSIVCCDSIGWPEAQIDASGIASDPVANAYVKIFSSHGYAGAPDSPLTAQGNKHVWETEWSTFDNWDPSWDDGSDASGFTWAQHIVTGLTSANLSTFLFWWGATTLTGNEGLLLLNPDNTVSISGRFWAFTNFSRFIRPGALRIGTSGGDSNLEVTAYRNLFGPTTIVVLNTATTDITTSFALQHTHGFVAIPYLTNGSNNAAIQAPLFVHNGAFSATIPARSLVTYQVF
jgi:O-glycosyl hydrolase